jgi:RNA polymerase sigma-70 factor (ECF subfamily)
MAGKGFPTAPSTLDLPENHAYLVGELRGGSTRALKWVVEAYRPTLLAYAQKRLGGVGDAEDVVQEAFLRFWTNRGRLQPDGCIRALLYCTVRSLITDEFRRWKRQDRCKPSEPLVAATSDSPLDALLSSELEQMADSAVHNMPPRRRTIWQMVREGGLTHQETAEALGVSSQTVANTMSSAMSDLRTSLKEVLDEAS